MLYLGQVSNPEPAADHPRQLSRPPGWQLKIRPDGTLAAETDGLTPPLTVTGDTLASLRKQTRDLRTRPSPGP
jgi:hypothetical protein